MNSNGKGESKVTAEESSPASSGQLVRRLLALTWSYRYGCIKVLLLHLISLSMGLFGLGLMGLGVDYIRSEMAVEHAAALIDGSGNTGAFAKPPSWPFGLTPPEDWSRMQVLSAIACVILMLAAFRAYLNYTTTVETNRLVQSRIVVDLRSKIYTKMQKLSFKFFDANASGSLINRATGDVQSVRMFIDGVVLTIATLTMSLAVYLVYMIRIHGMLTLVCLASTPMLWIITIRFARLVRPAYRENRERFDELILGLSENIQGVHVVKGFARQPEQINRFGLKNDAFRKQQYWIFRQVSFFQPLIHFITQINIIAMIAYGGYLVVKFEQAPDHLTALAAGISVGELLVFSGLLQQFSSQIAGISNIANSMQHSLIAAQRVFELLDTPLEVKSPSNPIQIGTCQGKLEFKGVDFAYKEGEKVLEDVTFSLEAGESAALLGQTGAGKTTLMSLIPRFYDPIKGSVLLDNTDLTKLDLDELRRNIGIVFQESFLFSNTVAANIAFGHPEATQEQIEKAARIAHAHDFITEMENGYKTILHEGGSNLSGGQRQRLAIARAILLEPRILLMDDPTAAIDPETEKEIMQAMESAMEGRTTLIVAHRLSTLRRADKALVLVRGKIAQCGTHEELMSTKGHYRWAANLQAPDKVSLELLSDGNVNDEA